MNEREAHPEKGMMYHRDDEIDLAELFAKIWNRKWWVVLLTAASALLALLYLFIAKPTYELKGSFRPAAPEQFVELNQTGVLSVSPEQAFKRVRKNIESRSVRKNFFSQPKIFQGFAEQSQLTQEQLFIGFDEDLMLHVPVAKKNQVLVSDANHLTFQHFDPEYGVDVVNGFLMLATQQAINELIQEFNEKKTLKIQLLEKTIEEKVALAKQFRELKIEELLEQNLLAQQKVADKLEAARVKAKSLRFDRIEQLKEAIAIAKQLQIELPTSFGQLSGQVNTGQFAITTEVGDRNEPLYMRGTRFLQAELEALEGRSNDDFTDRTIRTLEAELTLLQRKRQIETLKARQDDRAFISQRIEPLISEVQSLRNLDIDFSKMQMVRIDQHAVVPVKPIKPKKKLIVAAAVVLGGMLGLFVTLVVPARKNKEA
ncbi:Wzz/FepE/Etk N-terminal domain-containing protein [Motiliproteus sp.]|uniref:Wzz/FepE/Etk N-terminal domain-containing protein n=1 Tax=Motiliproteus sp. TaxID=1898955 RepID=UPI003BA8AFC6